jgi:hypothetical protein
MRIFRADWDGALELLSRVASNPKTPTELRIDSYLLMARANYQLGHDHQPYLLEAEKFDRFSQRIVRYRVMGMLAGLKTSDLGGLVDKAAATKEYLEAHAHLFSADDGWLPACRQLLAAITKPWINRSGFPNTYKSGETPLLPEEVLLGENSVPIRTTKETEIAYLCTVRLHLWEVEAEIVNRGRPSSWRDLPKQIGLFESLSARA